MCGICGVIQTFDPQVPPDLVPKMAHTMHHRGPDEDGLHQEPGVSLGFQRLAIIDLQGGHQPMSNEDESLWIVFNGEIYNFQELRKELEALNRHRFRTNSDTEIILHLYEEYGEACLQRLRGMFAFAIWDRKRQRLFAARDRFGKKPFFYFNDPKGGFVFASELKALREHPRCPRTVNPKAVYLYLNLQYIPAPLTIYSDVYKLPAAHCLSWSGQDGLQVRRYWDLQYDPKEKISYPEAQERLRHRLTESVSLRMISDVPLGAFLSGGIDSSIIVALMAQQSSRPIKTFSIGFEEQDYSEVHHAREVATRYKTDHHEFIVKPELIDILPKLAWFYSEPFADSSALPTYYLSQQTRQHVTVALSGDGGDESFVGYLRYRAMWAMQFWNYLPQSLRSTIGGMAGGVPSTEDRIHWLSRIQRLLKIGAMPEVDQYLRTVDYLHPEELQELWQPPYAEHFRVERPSAQAFFAETLSRSTPAGLMDRLMFLDLNHYLPDCLMVKSDIASMANSLEARAPLLDHVLVEECARWPIGYKYSPPNGSKRILRETFAKDLPPSILQRGKQGFGIPMGRWFRTSLKDYLRDVLLSPQALGRGYFQPDVLRRYIDEHQSGIRDRSYGLWALLMLELWHQAYPDSKS